jgi:putative addiction module component (TIGR02574 family)
MTQAVAQILEAAARLSPAERAELAERIAESVADDVPHDVAQAQLAEVRRRVAQVESGEVARIPGEGALAHVRGLVVSDAIRRDQELSSGAVQGRTHEEVMQTALRAL